VAFERKAEKILIKETQLIGKVKDINFRKLEKGK
jgi:hypothetical protein